MQEGGRVRHAGEDAYPRFHSAEEGRGSNPPLRKERGRDGATTITGIQLPKDSKLFLLPRYQVSRQTHSMNEERASEVVKLVLYRYRLKTGRFEGL